MRTRGGLRRLVVAALAVVVVLAAWRGWADPLVDAWAAWRDEESMSEVSLWGQEMRFWERLGKVCIFLAGMSVLLDLVDPEVLRKRGRVASDRIRAAQDRATAARMEKAQTLEWFSKDDQREAERLEGRYERVKDTLVYTTVVVTSPYSGSTFHHLRFPSDREPMIADLVDDDSGFDEESLRQLEPSPASRHEVCTRPSRCDRNGGDLCDGCRKLVHELVKSYLDGILTDADRDLLRRKQQVVDRAAKGATALSVLGGLLFMIGVVVLITLFALVAAASGSGSGNRDVPVDLGPGLALAGGASMFALAGFVILSVPGPRQHLSLLMEAQAAATVPVGALHSVVAMVLDKAKPGHVFRWIAFWLFLVGSHFDLLAT